MAAVGELPVDSELGHAPAQILGVRLGEALLQRHIGGRITPAIITDIAYRLILHVVAESSAPTDAAERGRVIDRITETLALWETRWSWLLNPILSAFMCPVMSV